MKSWEVIWQAEDGYAGGARPQYLDVSAEDFQDAETQEEVEASLAEMIDEDFNQNVSWSCEGLSDLAAQIFEAMKEEPQ